MTAERKSNWKCHVCKPRAKTTNNISYECVLYQDKSQQKQQREMDGIENENSKRFKEAISLNELQSSICTVQAELKSDVNEVKSEVGGVKSNLIELKTSVDQLSHKVTHSDDTFKEEMKNALSQITSTLSNLLTQMGEMREENKVNKKEIKEIDTKVNQMAQQMLNKKIEIKNIQNKDIQPNDVVKTIAGSINVNINEYDISDAYRLKNIKDKVIVEFTTYNKKREFMEKIKRHRIDGNIINNDNNNSYIYINDCLTAHNRKLLWLAKTKAKEANWKYVWSRNGSIFARKTENTPAILIKNTADIELIA
ncbi:uncharacterized protein LOC119613305 [Lucilia sericata]|uniref:uncharacterized protein LOC119613305 n=1 Tax=Lucilia sericata TaxID=13632 RepID=UPI0018A7FC49|nr:uncharacterized protein LOC119613305 [Lucilia sericata]